MKIKVKTKRIIAQMLAGLFVTGAVLTAGISINRQSKIDSTLNDINAKLTESYNDVTSSQKFKQEYLENCQNCVDDYTNNDITLEQCNAKLSYLQSQQYVDDFITSHSEDYPEVISLRSNKQSLERNHSEISTFSAFSTTGNSIGAVLSVLRTDSLKNKEDEYQY